MYAPRARPSTMNGNLLYIHIWNKKKTHWLKGTHKKSSVNSGVRRFRPNPHFCPGFYYKYLDLIEPPFLTISKKILAYECFWPISGRLPASTQQMTYGLRKWAWAWLQKFCAHFVRLLHRILDPPLVDVDYTQIFKDATMRASIILWPTTCTLYRKV